MTSMSATSRTMRGGCHRAHAAHASGVRDSVPAGPGIQGELRRVNMVTLASSRATESVTMLGAWRGVFLRGGAVITVGQVDPVPPVASVVVRSGGRDLRSDVVSTGRSKDACVHHGLAGHSRRVDRNPAG